jgi:release factor glutamine methyltransferase
MTWNEGYRLFLDRVQELYEPSEADIITSLIFESFASVTKKDIIRNGRDLMPEDRFKKLQDPFDRIMQQEPVQYVIGKALFCNLEFLVNPSVLIPRPETEELVERFLSLDIPKSASVLDIGTGSGCIAISILAKKPSLRVTAIDQSNMALETAAKNASVHHTQIHFKEMDFLDESHWTSLGFFDYILSNPPYIPLTERDSLAAHVKDHEPAAALFPPGEDPLIFYKKIAAFGKDHLSACGKMLLELHAEKADACLKLFTEVGYQGKILKDMYGKERMLQITLSP